MTTLLTSSSELEWRISRGTARLRRDGFDGAIVVGNANRFYLSGTIQQGHLLLPAEGEPLLLIRRGLDRARRVGPPNLEPLGSFRVELVEVEVELAPPAWPPVGWVSTLTKLKDLSTYTVTGTPCVFTTCSWWAFRFLGDAGLIGSFYDVRREPTPDERRRALAWWRARVAHAFGPARLRP